MNRVSLKDQLRPEHLAVARSFRAMCDRHSQPVISDLQGYCILCGRHVETGETRPPKRTEPNS